MRRALALLVVLTLLAGCTRSEGTNDPDGDGLETAAEEKGIVIEITTLEGIQRRETTSDPTKRDTDGDGLPDGDERARGTDPRDVDTDDDGLLDGDDMAAPDDATRDAWRSAGILEVNGTFLGELDACPPGGAQLRPNVASSDLPVPDGLLDGEELRGWTIGLNTSIHVTSDPCMTDTDGDRLDDHHEREALSDPRNPDTDNDGVRDGSDAFPAIDVGLAFWVVDVETANGTPVLVRAAGGAASGSLRAPSDDRLALDVPDQGARDRMTVGVVLSAEDLATGAPVALFEDPRGAIVTLDLVGRTAEGAESDGMTLIFRGADGTLTLGWDAVPR